MSYTSESWRKAITRLLELTSKNEVSWDLSDLYKGDSWTIVDISYMTKMKDKTYVISKTRSRHFLDETEYVWSLGFAFSVFEYRGLQGPVQIAVAPEMVSANALFAAAEANVAFNSDALGDLLD